MGTSKALLPWADQPLVAYVVTQALSADAAQVVVVLGPGAEGARAAVPRQPGVDVVLNPDVQAGRSASIRIGAASLGPDVGSIVVQSVDQPCPSSVLRLLYAAAEESRAAVVVPTFAGRRGHPLCLAGCLLPELSAVSEEEQGLRAVVRRHSAEVTEVDVPSESVLLNLNDPPAYEAAYERAPW